MKTLGHFIRDDFAAAFFLVVVAIIAGLQTSHIRISDVDDMIQRSTHAVSAAARAVLD
jgi:hypothetical protein